MIIWHGLSLSDGLPLTLSQTSPGFYVSQYKSFENTEGKGEIARHEQFLLFPQCFLSFKITFCHFHQIWNCRLQILSVWKSLKFVVWERVKIQPSPKWQDYEFIEIEGIFRNWNDEPCPWKVRKNIKLKGCPRPTCRAHMTLIVEVMVQTKIWPLSVTLTLGLPDKCFKWHIYIWWRTIVSNYFEIHPQL